MSDLNSSTTEVEFAPSAYVSSAPARDAWGQPPASHYAFILKDGVLFGQLVAGVYRQSRASEVSVSALAAELAAEFAALEKASDEALMNFESSL